MHKPKKVKSNELERMAAAARKISIAWKRAKLRKPLLQVRRSSADTARVHMRAQAWLFVAPTVRALRRSWLS